jgi:hypothetical protein
MIKRIFLEVLLAIMLVLVMGCALESGSDADSLRPLGVWWWHGDLIRDRRYLDFAVKNHVDEIYLARPEQDVEEFGPEIEAFVETAKTRGIKTYLLLGFGYISYEYKRLQDALKLYKDYQNRVSADRRFAGIHLDIEFHADHPDWENTKKQPEILAEYLALIVRLRSEISGPMDIDIPAWFDHPLSYNGEKKPLCQILIDLVDRVFVMSYRNTATGMYEIAKEEVAYARRTNKPLMLGAELDKDEQWDHVSYFEKTNAYLFEQLHLLKDMVNYPKAGISIHHMKTWHDLHGQ